jgi:hypothetical protein
MKVESKKEVGTKEWVVEEINIQTGCENNCRYCYAKSILQVWTGQIADWTKPEIRWKDVNASVRKYCSKEGYQDVMFPSSHDITPGNLSHCIKKIQQILGSGNTLLIVSKPNFDCISTIADGFMEYKDRILFRFTFTAKDQAILDFWEPDAPKFTERVEALKYAFTHGYQTSISIEPCLDINNVEDLISTIDPYVTGDIWIGPGKHMKQRSGYGKATDEDKKKMDVLVDEKNSKLNPLLLGIVNRLKNLPKVRFKEGAYLEIAGCFGPEINNHRRQSYKNPVMVAAGKKARETRRARTFMSRESIALKIDEAAETLYKEVYGGFEEVIKRPCVPMDRLQTVIHNLINLKDSILENAKAQSANTITVT